MSLSKVTIFPTLECNIGCKHCGTGRHVKKETMDDGLLERLLNDIDKTDAKITITGGEPLQEGYAYRLLDCLCNSGIDRKSDVTIFTNGSWAGSYDEAEQMIRQLNDANVSRVNISTDEYHREFVPLSNVANAINAADDSPIEVSIAVRSFKSTVREDTKAIYRLAELVGKKVIGKFYDPLEDGSIQELMQPKKRSRIPLIDKLFGRDKYDLKYNQGIVYVFGEPEQNSSLFYSLSDSDCTKVDHERGVLEGNAKRNLKKRDLLLKKRRISPKKGFLYQLPEGSACNSDGKIAVMPDGSLLPCCSFSITNAYKKINLGKYPETDLKSFEESLGSNTLSCIYSGRWKELHEIIESSGLNDLYFDVSRVGKTNIFESPCELCTRLHEKYFV